MFIQRISILLAMIFLVLFAFSFGAIPETENYIGLVKYKSDFMIAARWHFLCMGLAIITSIIFMASGGKK